MIISRITSRKNDNQTFFSGNRESPWFLVAFGMIGTSISGITFISIPGEVLYNGFSYFQIVLGYFFGYLIIANVLLPLYYRLNLTSIYTYLEGRYGVKTYKTGAFFFLLSRTLGSAIRLFLAAMVFQIFIFDDLGIPFGFSVVIAMACILLYSIRGGIKTIVWTDTLQTAFLVLSLIVTIIFINQSMDWSISESISKVASSNMSKIFFWDYKDNNFFVKQFLSGIFITVTMTGLDQDLMQKNLTCRNLNDAKKNMYSFSLIIIVVNLLFLGLGVLLYLYSNTHAIQLPLNETGAVVTDKVFPTIAIHYFPLFLRFIFLIGLTAATFASTDSALTALTTSFCIDILGFRPEDSNNKIRLRYMVHIAMSLLIVVVVIIMHKVSNQSVITILFKVAGYTYGPLLGLYSFGLFSKRRAPDSYIPAICLISPVLIYLMERSLNYFYPEYKVGFETLIFNGLLVYCALYIVSFLNPSEKKTISE
jgi:SSS family transporter